MIVYSPEQFLVLIPNTMTLEKDGNYFYVEKSLYDNLVVLKHQYTVERVGDLLQKENNLEIIEWLIPQLPSPLDIIAPFLRLVSKELTEDLELCIGSLHELFCTGLNPYGFVQLPLDARRGIEFGRTGSVYPEMWSSIMSQYVPYSTLEEMLNNLNKFNNIQYPEYQARPPMVDIPRVEEKPMEQKEFTEIAPGKVLFEDDDTDEIEEYDFFNTGGNDGNKVEESKKTENETVEANDENNEVAMLRAALRGGK